MAKKRSKKKVSAKKGAAGGDRVPRKENYTSARLTAHVERIREQAARLAGLARSMEDAGIEQILVDGHAMLLRGMNQIDNFADNASRAVREAKTALMDQ
jgi:hypothetical protein